MINKIMDEEKRYPQLSELIRQPIDEINRRTVEISERYSIYDWKTTIRDDEFITSIIHF
jgi:hypothetical protein